MPFARPCVSRLPRPSSLIAITGSPGRDPRSAYLPRDGATRPRPASRSGVFFCLKEIEMNPFEDRDPTPASERHGAARDPSAPPPGAAADWTVPQNWDQFSAEEHAVWDLLFARQ